MPAADDPPPPAELASAPRKLEGWVVLLVEDEPLIGMDVTDTLIEAGATVIGPVRTEIAALAAIDQAHASRRITGAVLDVDLGGHTSRMVAERLKGLEVPFILHTGNWPEIRALVASLSAPVVVKPSLPDDIVDSLAES
ncbi:hypothetical protein [uncultured Jannaschia sp.]|uniref:hypothetical protein n=1 Tax=uncultured Jannaschia sp. TaxID=293347 RepID=UPI00262B0386|nr:hypothetical protein [uncultured Jannaschia sp.]